MVADLGPVDLYVVGDVTDRVNLTRSPSVKATASDTVFGAKNCARSITGSAPRSMPVPHELDRHHRDGGRAETPRCLCRQLPADAPYFAGSGRAGGDEAHR